MKLKRKTKKRFTYVLALAMSAIAALPIFQPFLPQDEQPDIAAQYLQDMANLEFDKTPAADLKRNLEGSYEVIRVLDGDSVVIQFSDEERTLHLIGVDAPDKKAVSEGQTDEGKIAAEHLNKLLAGQTIGVEFDKDKENEDGDLLGYLYLEGVDHVNEWMIREGRAKAANERVNVKYQNFLKNAQRAAQKDEAGFWADVWK